MLLCICTVLQTSGSPYPPTFQITRDNIGIVLQDYVRVPLSSTTPGTYPPPIDFTNQLNRVSLMRFEPGSSPQFAARTFVSDLNRSLYILDRATQTFTTYINFEEVFPKFVNRISLGAGLATFAFDPDYEQNGRFYTIHTEGPNRPGHPEPTNTNLPGLDLTAGYVTTPSVDPPGVTILRHAVLVEWIDLDRTNTTFEGTAREILRIGFNHGNHSIADMVFNPAAQPSDADYGNLYVAVGDGGAGQEDDETHTIPQRLDVLPGKILRITPDLDRRPADELSANGRYRIPTTGPDPNPFTGFEPTVKKEIFSYGHRNPQRMSWDVVTNVLIVAEIGVTSWEEINIIRKGENYGFAEREGSEQLFVGGVNDRKTGSQTEPPTPFPDPDTLTVEGIGPVTPRYPVAAYSHRDGDAVSGGFVYRGSLLPQLQGQYIFGDITTGRILYADIGEMLAAEDGDPASLAPVRELQIVFDSPDDTPDRGAETRRLFDVIADEYAVRGGVASDGAALPGPSNHLSDSVDPDGVPYGGGRADIRLAMDRDGELFVLSKSDGMIRAIVAAVTGPTSATLTTTPNPSASGEAVQLEARVIAHPVSPGGSVEFFDEAVSLGVAPLADGVATLSVSGLESGTHRLTAHYLGDAPGFLSSFSHAVNHVVSAPDTLLLTVAIGGAGSGAVTSVPAGITCPGTCAYAFAPGASVSLTATPDGASTFTGWSGGCTGTSNCNVTLSAATSVTATFSPTGPDLIAVVGSVPATAAPGGAVTIPATTANQGSASAAASSTRYYLSPDPIKHVGDAVLGTRSLTAVAAGASVTPTAPFTVPSATPLGAYYVLACADDLVKVVELDELNNCDASDQLMTVTRPDLVTTAVGNPPAQIAPGASFSATDTVTNQGGHTAAKSNTRYYLSPDTVKNAGDVLLSGMRAVPALAPTASSTGPRTVAVPAATSLGVYYLLACADDLLKAAELVESNNCRASATQVLVGRPDLVTSNVSNPPSEIIAGTTFSLTATVTNQGTAGAGSSSMRYYLSLDALKDASDVLLSGTRTVTALAPGQSYMGSRTVTVPSTTSPGTYPLLACADDLAVVTELDDTNNCTAAATTIEVRSP